jgi:hypothetical protein
LVRRAALGFTSDFPEEPSELVTEALARLPAEARVTLLAASPLRWPYAPCSSDARLVRAGVAALDEASRSPLGRVWAIRAFHAWGPEGRAALDGVAGDFARDVRDTLDAYAGHRPRSRSLAGIGDRLRVAIHAAMDILDADPAAWPPRRVQIPVLDFGESPQGAPSWHVHGSWATVETYAKHGSFPVSLLVHEIRRLSRSAPSPGPRPTAHHDARTARLLVALARSVLPAWRALRPGDERVELVVDDAERVIGGDEPRRLEARRELHAFGYEDGVDPAVASAALTAVWAHSAALDDGENDVQDTPPDLAVTAFAACAENGPTRAARERAFWERFFLEIVPRVAMG